MTKQCVACKNTTGKRSKAVKLVKGLGRLCKECTKFYAKKLSTKDLNGIVDDAIEYVLNRMVNMIEEDAKSAGSFLSRKDAIKAIKSRIKHIK